MWSVFFVFLSYLDGEFVKADFLSSALEAEKESKEFFYLLNNTLCAKRSNVGEYHLLQVSDGIQEVRSVHDATGKLVDCALTTDPMQVKSFMYLCHLGLRGQVSVPVALNPNFKSITDVKLKCLQLKSKRASSDTSDLQASETRESRRKVDAAVLRRSKRGFTYPGTLWCGAGNNANHYDELGEFADTDKCCREHDHCPHVIHAFSTDYGYTNFKWHSISHCDCDNTMKTCLRNVNDSSSRVVGQAFFNVMEVPCFELAYQEQCVDRHWYGVCKRYGQVPVAVIKESIAYDFGGIDVIDDLPLPPLDKTASSPQPASAEPGETGSEGAGSTTQSTASSSTSTSTSGSQTTTTAIPEVPSLTNMVTAAEDFIKVLATVSSSQSTSPEAGKDETQGSEKKRKKNAGGKKRKNKKRRGKGRKRKLNVETIVVRVNEGGVGAASCHVVMEDGVSSSSSRSSSSSSSSSRTNIIDDLARGRQAEANVDMGSEMSREAREELTNAMMRDDPQRSHSMTPSSTPEESEKEETQKHKKESKVGSMSSTTTRTPPTTTPSITHASIVKTQQIEMSTLSPSTTTITSTSTSTMPSPPSVTVVRILKTKSHRERMRQGHVSRHRPGLRAHSTLRTPRPHDTDREEEQSITVSVRHGGDETIFVERGVEAAGRLSPTALGNANERGPLHLAATATAAGVPTIPIISPLRQAKERQRSKERGGRKKVGKVKHPPPSSSQAEQPMELHNHQTPTPDSREEPASKSPPVSATEASSTSLGTGYHVMATRLDYTSVARPVPPTTARSRGTDTARKGKSRWHRLKDSFRERRRGMSRLFGIELTQSPASVLPSVQSTELVVDKADYGTTTSHTVGVPVTIATTASMPTTTTALPPLLSQSGTSTMGQLEPPIKDTNTQDAPLMLLAGPRPSGEQRPKRKRHERWEGKKRKKAVALAA